MKTETYTDKTDWIAGQNEPDRVEWRYKGIPCLMVRAGLTGAWCGYAATTEGHPWYEQRPDAQVHGGVTFSGHCRGPVCHVPEPGEPDHVWWIGFDCAHCFDVTPAMEARLREGMKALGYGDRPPELGTYRDQAYVMKEVEDLADQILEAGKTKFEEAMDAIVGHVLKGKNHDPSP